MLRARSHHCVENCPSKFQITLRVGQGDIARVPTTSYRKIILAHLIWKRKWYHLLLYAQLNSEPQISHQNLVSLLLAALPVYNWLQLLVHVEAR